MMNTEKTREYADKVVEQLNILDPSMEYTVSQINKNHAIFTGIVAKKPGINIAPAVYIDDFLTEKKPTDEAARKILEIVNDSYKNSASITSFEIDSFRDYEKIKDKLSFIVTGDKEYADLYVSKECGANLYAIPIVRIKMGENSGNVKIKEEHLSTWGISRSTLLNDAEKAYSKEDIVFESIAEALGMVANVSDTPPMIVASNKKKYNGAAVMLLRKFDEMCNDKFPEGYYILPSSVHEVLVVPKNSTPVSVLRDMVRDVNSTCLNPTDILSDNVLTIENGNLVVARDDNEDDIV